MFDLDALQKGTGGGFIRGWKILTGQPKLRTNLNLRTVMQCCMLFFYNLKKVTH